MMELTLSILKPHVIKNPVAFQGVRDAIISNGFSIIKERRVHLTIDQARTFYAEHEGKFFYNRLISFICSGPLDVYILARDDAIKTWRNLMGPTKVYRAMFSDPDSLRGLYGLSDTRNATHGSDSPDSVEREIGIMFPEFSIKEWKKSDLCK